MIDPIQFFTNRITAYGTARPSYPPAILDLLTSACQLTPDMRIADIGSGTGLLSELLLQHGNPVFGIEPNPEMRVAGERRLHPYPHFTSVAGRAEATTLPDQSVQLVTAGMAFHWFVAELARTEFLRILTPPGWVVIVWIVRDTSATPFLATYERLWQTYATPYRPLDLPQVEQDVLRPFFRPQGFKRERFATPQVVDWAHFWGRILSAAAAPQVGHPQHPAMRAAFEALFAAYQVEGMVTVAYHTHVYYGQLWPDQG
jgi:SAM-dependent methyltransferase